MINRAISARYAKALFNLDCVENKLEQRLKDFDSLIKIFDDNPMLESLLKAPQINLKDKKKVFQDVLKDRFDPIFMNFLFCLIQKGRFVNVRLIANKYRLIVNEHLKIWEGDIVTAMPVDADSEMKLKQKLEEDFHKKIRLNKKVDRRIIGGAILILPNQILDWSVTGRLRKLKENLIAQA